MSDMNAHADYMVENHFMDCSDEQKQIVRELVNKNEEYLDRLCAVYVENEILTSDKMPWNIDLGKVTKDLLGIYIKEAEVSDADTFDEFIRRFKNWSGLNLDMCLFNEGKTRKDISSIKELVDIVPYTLNQEAAIVAIIMCRNANINIENYFRENC